MITILRLLRTAKPAIYLLLLFPFYLAYSAEEETMLAPVSEHSQKLILEFTPLELNYLSKKKTLNVCIDPNWMPFEMNKDGTHIGLTADYMRLFEDTLGIPIILSPTKTWSETLTFAESHQCDFISAVARSEEKSKYLDFSQGYFKSSIVIATDMHKPWVSDISELQDKRLAIVRGYAIGDFLKAKYPNLTLVEVDTLEKGLESVEKGEIYGYVGTLATVGYNIQQNYFGRLKITSKLEGSWDLNVGIRKDEPILTQIMDKMISAIPASVDQKILNNWISVSIAHEDPNKLTQSEKLFLQHHPIIRFRTRTNQPPFEFVSKGMAEGIAVDYIREIAKIVGITPQFVFDDSPTDLSHKELANGRVKYDTLLYSVQTEERRKQFNYGEPFLSYPVMVLVNKSTSTIRSINELNGKMIAMEQGHISADWIHTDYPDINVVEVSNTAQALYMVEDNRAEAYIGNLAVANYMIAYGLLSNVEVGIPTKYKDIEYHFVAPKDWPELTSILSKGFRSLTPSQHSLIQQRWYTSQAVEKQDYTLVAQILFASMVMFIWFYWSNSRLSAAKSKVDEALSQLKATQQVLEIKNIELERLSVTDKLTGIYNRVKLEAVLSNELDRAIRYGEGFAVILVDLDHFKHVNDTLGHQSGDRVLKEVADLFETNRRNVDTLGRWGGEEFLIICPHSTLNDATIFAEHLRENIAMHNIVEIGKITASFGVTAFRQGDNTIDLLSRSDEALYASKASGRNKVTSQA